MLFMGEEWAASTPWQFFTSFDDAELADAVRRGRRAEFGAHGWSEDAVPDPQDPATREASVLDWGEVDAGHHGRMLRWYAACTAARRELFGDGPTRFTDVTVAHDEDARWFVMAYAPGGRAAHVVVANLADASQEVPLGGARAGDVLLAWDDAGTLALDGAVRLPAHSVAVVRVAGLVG
jgi:maltooligosyltrehalose trehalohydrolase